MSTVIYGAVHLSDAGVPARQGFRDYWQTLAVLHGFCLHFDRPDSSYLEPDIASLWVGPGWLRFQVSADVSDNEANTLIIQATQRAGEVLAARLPGVTVRNVWARVPQWRCLHFMLWHEMITEAYLLVEDPSGDAATAREIRREAVTVVLAELWWDYVHNTSEDAVIYGIDLAQLPR